MCKLNPDYGRNTSFKFNRLRALPGTIVSSWHRILSGTYRWRAHKIKCRGTGLLIKSVKLLIKADRVAQVPPAANTNTKKSGRATRQNTAFFIDGKVKTIRRPQEILDMALNARNN